MSDETFGVEQINAAIERLNERKADIGAHRLLRGLGLPALISDFGLRHSTNVFSAAAGPMTRPTDQEIGAALWLDGLCLGIELGRCVRNEEE